MRKLFWRCCCCCCFPTSRSSRLLKSQSAQHQVRSITSRTLGLSLEEMGELLGVPPVAAASPLPAAAPGTIDYTAPESVQALCATVCGSLTSIPTTTAELEAAGVDVGRLSDALALLLTRGRTLPPLLLVDGHAIPWTGEHFDRYVLPLVPLTSSVSFQALLNSLGWNSISLASFAVYLRPFEMVGDVLVDSVKKEVRRSVALGLSTVEQRSLAGVPMLLPMGKGGQSNGGGGGTVTAAALLRRRPAAHARSQERLAELAQSTQSIEEVAASLAVNEGKPLTATAAVAVTFGSDGSSPGKDQQRRGPGKREGGASPPAAASHSRAGVSIPESVPASRHSQYAFLLLRLRELQRRATSAAAGEPSTSTTSFYFRMWDLMLDATEEQIAARREVRLREARALGAQVELEQLVALRLSAVASGRPAEERKASAAVLEALCDSLGPRPIVPIAPAASNPELQERKEEEQQQLSEAKGGAVGEKATSSSSTIGKRHSSKKRSKKANSSSGVRGQNEPPLLASKKQQQQQKRRVADGAAATPLSQVAEVITL